MCVCVCVWDSLLCQKKTLLLLPPLPTVTWLSSALNPSSLFLLHPQSPGLGACPDEKADPASCQRISHHTCHHQPHSFTICTVFATVAADDQSPAWLPTVVISIFPVPVLPFWVTVTCGSPLLPPLTAVVSLLCSAPGEAPERGQPDSSQHVMTEGTWSLVSQRLT